MTEILNDLDNWTIIKLVGGLSVIVSSIISLATFLIRTYISNKWKHKQNIEIENLKGKINSTNRITDNLTNSISNIYLSSNEKRIEYLDKVWNSMIQLKEIMPTIVHMAYYILTKDEVIKLPVTENLYAKASIASFNHIDYINEHNKITKSVEKMRPLVGENLYITFFVYQAFLGRLTFLIQNGLEAGEVVYWNEDETFKNQMFDLVMTEREKEQLLMNNKTSVHIILNFLEHKAIVEISEQVTGKRMSQESLKQLLSISELTKNTVA